MTAALGLTSAATPGLSSAPATMPVTDADLVGVWRLASFHDVEDGVPAPGPLGPDPQGLLFYADSRHLSVTMMSADSTAYMSYAGTWRRDGNRVIHHLTIAPNPDWIGTDQIRDLVYDGDRLTLYGNALVGMPRRRVLEWQRINYTDECSLGKVTP